MLLSADHAARAAYEARMEQMINGSAPRVPDEEKTAA